jgi:hypothetical protein
MSSLNVNQTVVFKELSSGQVATITTTRGFSVLTSGDVATIEQYDVNGAVQSSLSLPDGKSLEVEADGGSLLSNIKVTAGASATVYITMLNGSISVV